MKCVNNMTPNQLAVLANAIAIGISEGLTADEINVLSGFIGSISATMALIAAQQSNLQSIADKKKQIEDLKKQIQDLEKSLCT